MDKTAEFKTLTFKQISKQLVVILVDFSINPLQNDINQST